MIDRPRVRFAPSPTGYFHVGGAKTALYNWIFARQHEGTFVLRIEDTDAERNRPEWIEGIQRALEWVGVDWDEGPVFQSQRADRHRAVAATLAESGRAYWCGCTRDQITARTGNEHIGYDGHCRDLGLPPGEGRALRFATPLEGSVVVRDLIRGEPTFEAGAIEDFVIQRANGSPMFLLANVVDDVDMAISHVIRGEEHLPNTPKAQLLWEAMGAGDPPVWAHVPILVNEKRQKLSKRRDKVAVEDYRDEGILPEAMRSFLMLLGWAPKGDDEVVPFEVILEQFRLDDVNPSPAFFDERKLRAINGDAIRALPVEEFVRRCDPWITPPSAPWPAEGFDAAAFATMAPLVQERVAVMSEVPAHVDFLFLDAPPLDDAEWAKGTKGPAAEVLAAVIERLDALTSWEADAIKAAVTEGGEALDLKLNKAQAPVRVAITGRTVGPPLFEAMVVLGRERSMARLRAAAERLAS